MGGGWTTAGRYCATPLTFSKWCLQKEALQKLKDLFNQFQDNEAREDAVRNEQSALETESLAASERLEMLQSRLNVALGELRLINKNIADTESGVLLRGKLVGLPQRSSKGSTVQQLIKGLGVAHKE